MRRMAWGLICLVVAQSSFAQHVVSIFDGNGNEVGTPVYVRLGEAAVTVFRPDGLAILLRLDGGSIDTIEGSIFHKEPDCAGQAYIRPGSSIYFDWLSSIETLGQPYSVALVQHNLAEAMVAKSQQGSQQCQNIEDTAMTAFPLNIVDPADYGLIDINGPRWGYPVPLEFRTTLVTPAGEGIFCNGFENCPQP